MLLCWSYALIMVFCFVSGGKFLAIHGALHLLLDVVVSATAVGQSYQENMYL